MQGKMDVEQALIQAFKELVYTMPVEKITIKEITDKAGVIRPTFYHHFQDKYEVIERIFRQEILQPAYPLLENEMIDEAMVLIFSNLCREKNFYVKLVHMEGQNSFSQISCQCVEEILFEFFSARAGNKVVKDKWLTPALLAKYYAQSMVFVMVHWIESGMPLSPNEIAEIYDYIITRSMKDILEELKTE